MRSLEPAAIWTASPAAPRRGCQGGCLRANPDPGVILNLPANRGRSSVWAKKVAACCCTRRYSAVCSGRWRSRWTAGASRRPLGLLHRGLHARDPLQHHRPAIRHRGDDGLQPMPRAAATAGRLSRCDAAQRQIAGAGRCAAGAVHVLGLQAQAQDDRPDHTARSAQINSHSLPLKLILRPLMPPLSFRNLK